MEISAIVYRKGKKRAGKGFSKEELKAVGLSIKEALALKIPVDPKGEQNMRVLKEYLSKISQR
ncbi:MAG: ribosomal protein L13e [Candidatus Bathyarchaeia archaeon]